VVSVFGIFFVPDMAGLLHLWCWSHPAARSRSPPGAHLFEPLWSIFWDESAPNAPAGPDRWALRGDRHSAGVGRCCGSGHRRSVSREPSACRSPTAAVGDRAGSSLLERRRARPERAARACVPTAIDGGCEVPERRVRHRQAPRLAFATASSPSM
jgi:hypothetical protein